MQTTHVSVAVIESPDDHRILIAKRPEHTHLAGLWEFPGGKVEAGETAFTALQREIREEWALEIETAEPLIQIPFAYPEKNVLLDVWRALRFSGTPQPCENQHFLWVCKNKLRFYDFPPANHGIITALQLPQRLLITGEFTDFDDCIRRTRTAIQTHGLQYVLLRAHALPDNDYQKLACLMRRCCHTLGAKLLLYARLESSLACADGLHLTSNQLSVYAQRPVPRNMLLGASCHDVSQLQQAMHIDADYVLLSPVQATRSHPGELTLGWEGFAQLAAQSTIPVFALGGMGESDLPKARLLGAQGIAAISAWW